MVTIAGMTGYPLRNQPLERALSEELLTESVGHQ